MLTVVLAVNDKKIENYLFGHPKVQVLTIVKKREQLLNRVDDLSPHAVIISSGLSGKLDIKLMLQQLKESCPKSKIIFLYGRLDNESKTFLDFLVRNGIYNFIVGSIDEVLLDDVLFKDTPYENVSMYLLTNTEAEAEKKSEQETEEKEQEQIIPQSISSSSQTLPAPSNTVALDVVIPVVKQLIGTYQIGVGSLFNRAGSTHFSLELAAYLHKNNISAGVIVNADVFFMIKEYFEVESDELIIHGITFYTPYSKLLAHKNHSVLIYDLGKIEDDEDFNYDFSVLINPMQAWELDDVIDFIADNSSLSKKISWLFYPCNQNEFAEIKEDMRKVDCLAFSKAYNPCWYKVAVEDESLFKSITKDIFDIVGGQQKRKFGLFKKG